MENFKMLIGNRVVIALIGVAVGSICPPAVPVVQAILLSFGG